MGNQRIQLFKHTLGELLDVTRGMSLPGSNYATSGDLIRLTLGNFDYAGNCFKENTSKDNIYYSGVVPKEFIMKAGDIITPLTEQTPGLLGTTARIPESGKYIQSQDVALIKCKTDKLDPLFCYYLVSSSMVKQQLAAGSQQTKIRHTSPDKIKACVVYIPEELSIQHRIGALLTDIDDKIALNCKACAELEALAKQVYDYWFVQFDFPNESGLPYKSSKGEMVYNSTIKRYIPNGWEVHTLGARTTCLLGGTPSRQNKEYWGGNINWINSGKVNDFRITTPSETITELGLKNTSTYLMPRNTVVIAITGATMGQVSLLNIDACGNQSIVGVLETEDLHAEYLYPMIVRYIPFLVANKAGAAQPHVNKQNIEEIAFALPPAKVLNNYYSVVSDLYKNIMKLESENLELRHLKDYLLPKLITGQVSIKE